MAKLDMGILGGFSGRVGTVVGYHRRGAWFVRAYQPHIKDRKSAAQLEQRSRFKAMIQFASPATPMLRVGLRKVAADWQITEGNAFLKLNHQNFLNNQNNQNNQNFQNNLNNQNIPNNRNIQNNQINYSGLQFSYGHLTALKGLQYTVDEEGVLHVRWESAGGVRSDRVHIYVYCRGRGLCAEGRRGEGRVQLLLPEDFMSDELHVWAFAASANGEVSATVYGAPSQPDVLLQPHHADGMEVGGFQYVEVPVVGDNPNTAIRTATAGCGCQCCNPRCRRPGSCRGGWQSGQSLCPSHQPRTAVLPLS